MNCDRAQKDLQLYIDGRLDQRRFSLLEIHLDACDRCQRDLAFYEVIQTTLVEDPAIAREPEGLTRLIMARIATAEARRTAQAAQPFTWRWGDALLAALLGTISTLFFLFINPGLRTAFFTTLTHNFPLLAMLTQAEGPGSIPWIAWIIWITAGIGLALWLAGAEMRASWRRSLAQRLPARPQFRQLW